MLSPYKCLNRNDVQFCKMVSEGQGNILFKSALQCYNKFLFLSSQQKLFGVFLIVFFGDVSDIQLQWVLKLYRNLFSGYFFTFKFCPYLQGNISCMMGHLQGYMLYKTVINKLCSHPERNFSTLELYEKAVCKVHSTGPVMVRSIKC